MQGYADYTFYVDTYHGSMNETDFSRHILSATQYIRYVTAGKSDAYAGDELKYASCEAADMYYAASQADSGDRGRIKSENNDGYSVSYASEGKEGETDEELISRKIYGIVRRWLLPTGLMYRKVRCGCDYECRHHDL